MARQDFIVPFCSQDPEVLYADDDLLLVEKPPGLLSVPGRHPDNKDCLISRLQLHFPGALIVHRLDMDTSGIMVIARHKASHAHLSRQFEKRTVSKEYEAMVYGMIEADEGVVDLPLITDWPNRPLQKVCYHQGKPARTHFRVMERITGQHATRVKLTPETGRSHQLRVHLNALGHPILGDNFYAPVTARAMADRLLLHASKLQIVQPSSGQSLEWKSRPAF
jgi:tRNA pseudouridine32 synthase / 23S rRNA pseudouridine746 synthase